MSLYYAAIIYNASIARWLLFHTNLDGQFQNLTAISYHTIYDKLEMHYPSVCKWTQINAQQTKANNIYIILFCDNIIKVLL